MTKPTATNVKPTAWLKRTVVDNFSIVISTPRTAIHTTFIAPAQAEIFRTAMRQLQADVQRRIPG